MVDIASKLFTDIVVIALPVAVVFEIGNLIVSTFIRAALGGRLWVGR